MTRRLLSLVLCLVFFSALYAEDMVEISVEVTEINNNRADELGIKWADTVVAGEMSLPQATGIVPATLPNVPTIIDPGDWKRYTALSAQLKLLATKGAAQILSKPKIITKSGTKAKIVVGGEIPITAGGVGGGSIDWKEFGIMAEIEPKILSNGYIDLTLNTQISRLDWANSVNGNPAIMKREANSSVTIKSGQTITLAGMIETKKENSSEGVPLLSDIPILGALFSRKVTKDVKNNILIFVTPKIITQ